MQLKSRILCMQCPKQIFVPFDPEIRMKATLHQDARSAKRDRLIDPFTDLIHRVHVCVRLTWPAIERAERADYIADVRVIYIAIDDVCDDIGRIMTHPNLMRSETDADEIFRFEKGSAVFGSEPLAGDGLIEYGLNIEVHSTIILTKLLDFFAAFASFRETNAASRKARKGRKDRTTQASCDHKGDTLKKRISASRKSSRPARLCTVVGQYEATDFVVGGIIKWLF